jgi:exosortase H (IPTLxxWG-CTERM-specific)
MRMFDASITTTGNVIATTRSAFAVAIEAGCNGVEATLVLTAAMLAFPATWRHRLAGIVVGVAAVQLLNVVRVVSLFYLGQWNQQVFEWAHLYVWQALIMLDVLIVWVIWVRLAGRRVLLPDGALPA